MVATSAAYYNKYLRQLQTFSEIPTILTTLVVPTSVALVWNRISMVLKGHDFYEFNWYDVAGCVVNDTQITLTKQDINHVMVYAGQITPCFSFRSAVENPFWVISKGESDLAVMEEEELEEEDLIAENPDEDKQVKNSVVMDETPTVNEVPMPILRSRSEVSNGNDSNSGFSKRYHSSYNPNAMIVGCASCDGFSRNSSILQPFSNEEGMSDSTMHFGKIPEVDIEESFVCSQTQHIIPFEDAVDPTVRPTNYAWEYPLDARYGSHPRYPGFGSYIRNQGYCEYNSPSVQSFDQCWKYDHSLICTGVLMMSIYYFTKLDTCLVRVPF